MKRGPTLDDGDRNIPITVIVAVILLLVAGAGVIFQNEAAYEAQAEREAMVKAEILAASVTAALDFGDPVAAQEAVDAVRVDRQVRAAGVYDASGALFAGYARSEGMLAGHRDRAPRAGEGIVAWVTVGPPGEKLGSVYLATDREPLASRVGRLILIALLVIMAALVVAVLGLGQAALRRANQELRQRAEALGLANAELEVQMEEREKAEEQLRQSQKMQALGQLTGGIAHDFNNLLTVIQGSADILRRPELADAKRIRFAEAVAQASDRAAALTSQLLAFGRRQPLRPEAIDVNELVCGMSDLLDRSLGERIEVRLELHCDRCVVEADRAQLESAVLNLAANGRDAMAGSGVLTIVTAPVEEDSQNSMVAIAIGDSGTGMDEETRAKALEPFFTTKEPGKGTGLGLSQVYGFASQSGGELRIDSAPGEGTVVTILLPQSDTDPSAREVGGAEQDRPREGLVLLVEDHDEVADFAAGLLADLGYSVVRASDAEEALERIAEQDFDVVLSDVVMPGMGGIALADELARRAPGLPVILTTGFSPEIVAAGVRRHRILLKPYRSSSLAAVIDEAMGAAGDPTQGRGS